CVCTCTLEGVTGNEGCVSEASEELEAVSVCVCVCAPVHLCVCVHHWVGGSVQHIVCVLCVCNLSVCLYVCVFVSVCQSDNKFKYFVLLHVCMDCGYCICMNV